ncbi:AAA family ATPase [Natrinema soli]|uniref:AAA family ATPase n=1 Tax=Natrinema soli TaxID=1930624 RepID=A0ABD5SJH1_9EURY|nr:AAA family ATPase [Natrinema soli]
MELTIEAAFRSNSTDSANATLAPATMTTLGVADGDAVQLAIDEQTAVARVRTGSTATTGENAVRLARSFRESLGADVGATVTVTAVDPKPADRLTLELPPTASETIALDLAGALVDRVLVAGQTLTVGDTGDCGAGHTADSGHGTRVHVTETEPGAEPVVVRDWTAIRLSGAAFEAAERPANDPPAIGYDDIGGLDGAIGKIRELVELPLSNPERFRALNIDPPHGVLLYGPPGTGKTQLVRATAAEAGVSIVIVRGSEVVSRDTGEENPFETAMAEAKENAPAVLFVDDLDALTDEFVGERGHRRVARLVSTLDAHDPESRVAVVGATTDPESLDRSLRRAGRFDHDVEVAVPDRDDRREILDIYTRTVPLADDVDLDRIAERTHGFVGADLERLIRAAGIQVLHRNELGPVANDRNDDIDAPVDTASLAGLELTTSDIESALRSIDPSALREVFVEVPDATWDDVGGLAETTRRLRETVQWPLEHPDAFDRVSLRPAKGVLLYGPPGTGKTLLAKVVANEAASNFISIKGPELLNKYVGESERGIREIFEKARTNAPTVVFFDEIDAIAAERGGGSTDSGVSERVVSQLLTELDGIEELEDVVVIATTNRPDLLDDALMRPGRFDRHIHVGTPDEASRRQIFAVHTRDRPLAADVDLDALTDRTAGYVGADIEAVCREAAMIAVRQFVDDPDADSERIHITAAHFDDALQTISDERGGQIGMISDPLPDFDDSKE